MGQGGSGDGLSESIPFSNSKMVYKYSLGFSKADQKKPDRVIQALKEYYSASFSDSWRRQKLFLLLQHKKEGGGSWEIRVVNQVAQCEYGK